MSFISNNYYFDMQYNLALSLNDTFESEKNKKALAFTAIACSLIFLIAYFVSWELPNLAPPPIAEQIEINLGNDAEGFGKEQPLIKGEKAPGSAPAEQPRAVTPT
ncbi:MAG TPA: hypothetical protein VKH37_02535, partial [Ferruginibacter sp.]|nr:hypothetical protein [Ferruginibacter sp.]